MQIVTWIALGALAVAVIGGGGAGLFAAITANRTASFLAVGAGVATLALGFVGTVCGLIAAFGAVAVVDPSDKTVVLSDGIGVAMRATEVGIIGSVALVCLGGFGWARARRSAWANERRSEPVP